MSKTPPPPSLRPVPRGQPPPPRGSPPTRPPTRTPAHQHRRRLLSSVRRPLSSASSPPRAPPAAPTPHPQPHPHLSQPSAMMNNEVKVATHTLLPHPLPPSPPSNYVVYRPPSFPPARCRTSTCLPHRPAPPSCSVCQSSGKCNRSAQIVVAFLFSDWPVPVLTTEKDT